MGNKLLVSYIGAPNSGKTTASTSLFSSLKKVNIESIYVSEFAKDVIVEGNKTAIGHQKVDMVQSII